MSGTAKAMEVWQAGLEYAQGDEAKFRRFLDEFQRWAGENSDVETVRVAAKAIRFRLILREGKPLMARWGME